MRIAIFALLSLAALPAMADDYVRVTGRGDFVALVGGRNLTSLGVNLTVSPSGILGGRAFGRDVIGEWTWSDGYFCRTMQAGDRVFERNCQLVQKQGDRIRFVADRGKGDTADLRIR